MNDLSELLAPVTDDVDRSAPTITLEEITGRPRFAPTTTDAAHDPTSITIDEPVGRRAWHGALIGVAAAVALVGGLVAVSNHGHTPIATVPLGTSQTTTAVSPIVAEPTSTDVPSSAPPSAPLVVDRAEVVTVPFSGGTMVVPTLLQPTTLPAGFQFLQGGSVDGSGPAEVDLWSPDLQRWYSISWSPGVLCSSPPITAPFGPLASNVDDAIAQLQPPGTVDPFPVRQLKWCNGHVLVSVDGMQVGDDDLAALARTVSADVAGDRGTFTVPTGFTYRLGLLSSRNSALAYSNGEITLRVLSFAAASVCSEACSRSRRSRSMGGLHSGASGRNWRCCTTRTRWRTSTVKA
jgi:hypothetical protein